MGGEDDKTQLLLSFGTLVPDEEFIETMKRRIWDLLGWRWRGPRQAFPGSQPVSFTRHHLRLLQAEDYYVCEKSDGVRYLVYFSAPFGRPEAFLVDRNWRVRRVEHFSIPTKVDGQWHEDTLLDGELIAIETHGTGGDPAGLDVPVGDAKEDQQGPDCEKSPTVDGTSAADATYKYEFLIFDCLMVNGVSVVEKDLPGRLKHVQNDIITPLTLYTPPNPLPMGLQLKTMWKPYSIAQILEVEIPKQRHGNDGLIFTPVRDRYESGTCERLLKWKPSELNSVDFLLVVHGDAPESERYELRVAGPKDSTEQFAYHPPNAALEELNGKVIECRYDSPSGGWIFLRERKDKVNANYFAIVNKIMTSIRDNVTGKELVDHIPAIRRAWKQRESLQLQKRAPTQWDTNGRNEQDQDQDRIFKRPRV